MSRHPHEQNLPDGVTNKDIEEHFGYAPEEEKCHHCGDPVYADGVCRDCYLTDYED